MQIPISKKVFNKINRACESAFQDIVDDLMENYEISEEKMNEYCRRSRGHKKKKQNGYTIFRAEKTEELKSLDKNFGEISKIIGNLWSSMSKEKKEEYSKKAINYNSS